MALPFRHVGLNAVFLQPRMGGLGVYTKELVAAFRRLAPELRVSLFLSPAGVGEVQREPWAGEVGLVTHPLLGLPGLKAVGELTLLGALAARRRVDVLHSVALTGPLRTRGAHVVTIADTTWITHPDPAERVTVAVWKALVPPVARRADRVIAIAGAGADDIVEHLGVARERIDVVQPGFGTGTRAPATSPADLRARLGLGDGPLVLTVSQKRVHKNLMRLVRAMARVREHVPGAVLVMPGNPTPHERELEAEAARLGLDGAIAFIPYVGAGDLEGLYAAASCFVIASTQEGFGLPVLEAQARGLAVASSNAAALPEAAGPGAAYFDPYDEAAIAAAIVSLLTDRALADRLVAAGREHAATFTWERAAQGTLETYERAWRARAAR